MHPLRICGDHSLCIPVGLLEGAGTTDGQPTLSHGAKYFFKNHDDYLYRHPTGTFQGENAIFIGVIDELSMFAGFSGSVPSTISRGGFWKGSGTSMKAMLATRRGCAYA